MTWTRLWQEWCAGLYVPRHADAGTPPRRALRRLGVITWWGAPFILIDGFALLLASSL